MNRHFDRALETLAERSQWEKRQRIYSEMRHDGLRRRNKPFPNAADSHFPLVNMVMSKWKPFWLAQAFSNERLAEFKAMREQLNEMTEAAADYFDFELKQRTEFEERLERTVDIMLLRGRGVMMSVVDPFEGYALKFRAIDPMFILIGKDFDDFGDADEFTWVQHLTVAQYKANRIYNQDESVIAAIRGGEDIHLSEFLKDKQSREGVTHSNRSNIITLWNTYTKTSGGRYAISTYSPQAPDKKVRQPRGLVYKVEGKPSLPFHSFIMEIKDEGWYAPRGIAELNAAFETYITKLWNEKSDAMTFGNKPLFTSEGQIPNTTNIRFHPGELLPGNIKAVQMPQPAFSFDQEINFTRQLAESNVMMPDFGITRGESGPGKGGGGPRTAAENNRIAALNDIGVDHNGRIFRRRLARLYKHVWGLMLQYKRTNLSYFAAQNLKVLPEQALHDQYLVSPDGSPDSWDKQAQSQKGAMLMQTYRGDPSIDQDELNRIFISSVDSRYVNRLLIPQNVRAGEEMEDEAKEILLLERGFPAQVKPNEDHAVRIKTLIDYLMAQQQIGTPVNPIARQRIQEHMAVHFQMFQDVNPDAANKLKQEIAAMDQQAAPMPEAQSASL